MVRHNLGPIVERLALVNDGVVRAPTDSVLAERLEDHQSQREFSFALGPSGTDDSRDLRRVSAAAKAKSENGGADHRAYEICQPACKPLAFEPVQPVVE